MCRSYGGKQPSIALPAVLLVLYRAFRSSLGVDRQLISVEWFANHYQWLVWKLATMEVCFPEVLGGR